MALCNPYFYSVYVIFTAFLEVVKHLDGKLTVPFYGRHDSTDEAGGWLDICCNQGGRNKLRLVLEAYSGVRREEY